MTPRRCWHGSVRRHLARPVTADLVNDGVRLFADAFDKLLGAVARKRAHVLGPRAQPPDAGAPAPLAKEVEAAHGGAGARPATCAAYGPGRALWTGADEANWLGWLDVVDRELDQIEHAQGFRPGRPQRGLPRCPPARHGRIEPRTGSHWRGRSARRPAFPSCWCSIPPIPQQIRTLECRIDPARTLFIVSSKSGSTLEPNILKHYFFAPRDGRPSAGAKTRDAASSPSPIPDRNCRRSPSAIGFRHVASAIPSIGGRYSVLSDFGLVPAAAMGLDVGASCAPRS